MIAVVTADGIEVGGQVYPSPSAAAKAQARGVSTNGWVWWKLESTGKTLASLRES